MMTRKKISKMSLSHRQSFFTLKILYFKSLIICCANKKRFENIMQISYTFSARTTYTMVNNPYFFFSKFQKSKRLNVFQVCIFNSKQVSQGTAEVQVVTNTCVASSLGVKKVGTAEDARSVSFEFESFFITNQSKKMQNLECQLKICDKIMEDCGSKAQGNCPNQVSDAVFGYHAFA